MIYNIKTLKLFNYNNFLHTFKYRNISGLNLWGQELTAEIKHKIEKHWSEKLKTEKYNENDTTREKYYVLSMFPYPSGYLHMGHVRVYTISDSIARFQRMNGKNVIHPIGWDAFGLPAENASIERNVAPEDWTKSNIAHMKEQLKQLGCSFEWDREFTTCDPEYYKWTQELFLKLYDVGMVYQRMSEVNWDPVDQTVLAQEQIDDFGKSWRSGALVEKKELRQWYIRTSKFANDLYNNLESDKLEDWRDILKIQKNWIGLCDGVRVDFKIEHTDPTLDHGNFISVWSQKPEYFDRCNFIVVNPNHNLAKGELKKLDDYTSQLENVVAINPFTSKKINIYASHLQRFMDGSEAYLGSPYKSEDRDFMDMYNIPFLSVKRTLTEAEIDIKRTDNILRAKELNIGGYWTSANLKDWLISRQRYWGTPIPIIHCENCGPQPVPRDQLPVKLPKLKQVSQRGSSFLKENLDWFNTVCPKCNGNATRETDTMDTFVDSSWYFLRYLNPQHKTDMFDVERAKTMMPVDLYIGGKEHAVLHLYYARFVSHFLHSIGLLPEKEPFKRLLVQGMVMGRSYRLKGSGQYLPETDVEKVDFKRNKAVCKKTGAPVVVQWEKMSKSKQNGVDPSKMFQEYGIDTTRLLILADVAPTSHRNWNSSTFPGVINWQRRLWLTIESFIKYRNETPKEIPELEFKAHEDYLFDARNYYTKGATFNYCSSQQISVAISKLQGLTNNIRKMPPAIYARSLQFERALACQMIILAPMAPHFTSELWSGFLSAPNRLNHSGEILWEKSVLEQKWPEIDPDYSLDLVFQVNGHDNSVIKIPRKEIEVLPENEAINMAFMQKEVQEVLTTRQIESVSYIMYKGYEGVVNIKTKGNPPKTEEYQDELSPM